MFLGEVRGTVVAERKAKGLVGKRLLLLQPLDDQKRPFGELLVAVDAVQAGPGDLVYWVGSREAALALSPTFVTVDAAIIGHVDHVYTRDNA